MNDVSELITIALKIALLVTLCFSTIHTLFMMYHWYTFGQNKSTATIASVIYLCGLLLFFMIMVGSVFTYSYV